MRAFIPAVVPAGKPGNIVTVGPNGVLASDSGLGIGTDANQIPNAAQISGMISREITNAPTLPSVVAATTGNIMLSGAQQIDSLNPPAGAPVLVMAQNAPHENGPYLVNAAGPWVRCYYTGAAWAPVTAAQKTYEDLDIDLGIIQVTGGPLNGNTSYRCAVSDTSKALNDATVSVTFSQTTLAPVTDPHNRHVSVNNGNDNKNEGTPDFPHQRIGRALQGMAFPGVIKVSVSGTAYSEAVAIPAAATALTVETAGDDSRGGGVRWTQPWTITYPAAAGFLTLRGITWATGGTNPFSAAGGKAATVMIENCAFSGAMTDITPLPGEFTGTLELRNIDMTAAPGASLAIRFDAGTYEFSDQQLPVPITIAGGGTGYLATINIEASCNPGAVRVPLNFFGKVNRYQPAPTRLVSVITTQAALDTLIANKAAASSGFYLLSGFVPTQNAGLAGGIIGHYGDGSVATNWWERSFTDAPATVDVVGQAYVKSSTSTSWQILASSVTTVTEPLTIQGSTTNPTKAATRDIDYINIVDDGSGWCTLTMRYYASNSAGSARGSGTYLINLPGGYKFDTTVHQTNAQLTNMAGMGEVLKILPGSDGIIQHNGSPEPSNKCAAVPHSATQFKIVSQQALSGAVGYWFYWSSVCWSFDTAGMSCSMTFRFKKG